MDYSEIYIRRIRSLCAERGIAINRLAVMSDVKQSTLDNIVRGLTKNPRVKTLHKLAHHSKQDAKNLTLAELKRLYSMMQPLSIEEREISFSLKEDRADVIIPAAEIFLKACEYLKCENIMVPNISLADSIVDGLYEKMMAKTEE